MAAAIRIKSNEQSKGTGNPTNHCKILEKAIKTVPETEQGIDKIPNTYLDLKGYNLISEVTTQDYTPQDNVTYNVYTDGAKNIEGVGCGFYSSDLHLAEAIALNKTSTVFQAEMIALTLAVKRTSEINQTLAENSNETNNMKDHITFITDSVAIIHALRKLVTRSKVVSKCNDALQKLANKYKITVKWTKSHSKSLGNNRADKLAKQGAKLPPDKTVTLCKQNASEVRNLLRVHTVKEHQTAWTNIKDCKHVRNMFPSANKNIMNNLIKMARQDLRLMIGIITGLCNLNYHLHKIGNTDSPLCRGCLEETVSSVEHVLLQCKATEDMRRMYLPIHTEDFLVQQSKNSGSNVNITTTQVTLGQLCQRSNAMLQYFKELGWLG